MRVMPESAKIQAKPGSGARHRWRTKREEHTKLTDTCTCDLRCKSTQHSNRKAPGAAVTGTSGTDGQGRESRRVACAKSTCVQKGILDDQMQRAGIPVVPVKRAPSSAGAARQQMMAVVPLMTPGLLAATCLVASAEWKSGGGYHKHPWGRGVDRRCSRMSRRLPPTHPPFLPRSLSLSVCLSLSLSLHRNTKQREPEPLAGYNAHVNGTVGARTDCRTRTDCADCGTRPS